MQSPAPSEASEASAASVDRAARPKPKSKPKPSGPHRHRLTRAEVRLVAETYREHKHLKWAAQVAMYNAAARQRGWFDQIKVTTYTARCCALRQELEFKADAGAGKMCQKWLKYEDEELAKWDWRGRMQTLYPVFIEHMRAAFDPSYFRSVMAISSRLAILGISVQRVPVKEEEENMEEEIEAEDDEAEDGEAEDGEAEGGEAEDGGAARSEERHDSSADSDSAEHHKPGLKRHRMSKKEMRLVAETFHEHKHKSWATQVAIYNAAARQRGWYDQIKVKAFRLRCNGLKQEQQFRSDAGANATCLRWAPYEDEMLTKWDWRGNVPARYPAFIEHMRAAFDPNYFRSVVAVSSRMAILSVDSPQTATKTETEDVVMEEEHKMTYQGIGSAPASPPATMQYRATQTTASPPRGIVDRASSPDEVDIHSGVGRSDIVPAVVPIFSQEYVATKLLNMQRVRLSASCRFVRRGY
jgi:hypothetical protein